MFSVANECLLVSINLRGLTTWLLIIWSGYWPLDQVIDHLFRLLTTWSDHKSPGEDGVLDSHSRRQEVSSRSIQRQKCFAHRRTKKVQKEGNMTKVLHASLLSLRPTGDFFPVFVLSINLLLSSASISQSATSFFSSTQIFLITAHSIGWSSSLKTSEALTPTSQEFVI